MAELPQLQVLPDCPKQIFFVARVSRPITPPPPLVQVYRLQPPEPPAATKRHGDPIATDRHDIRGAPPWIEPHLPLVAGGAMNTNPLLHHPVLHGRNTLKTSDLFTCQSRGTVDVNVALLCVVAYPGLWSAGVRLHAVLTGGYVAGHLSVLLINSPNEQVARDIGRAIMERQMAASINILPKASSMYYWKGEVQDATEIVMLVKTKTSKIQTVIDYVRSIHPYENPDVLSLSVGDANAVYMRWMDEAVPDN
ncbi:Protein CutA [Merluccius polli]|uniref:Protein CutA n=1 Tax=Merluccius polli TaxID=89951 RepID=A0AA47NXZ7_MERPO|nr:Protein CutA [Merluccius polli]